MKKVLIIGTGKSGLSVAEFLDKKNIEYKFFDDKTDVESTDIIKNVNQVSRDFTNAVISPGVPLDSEIIKRCNELDIKIEGEIEFAYKYIDKPIIGITGTNGKTTTTSLIGHIISAKKNVCIAGNIGVPLIECVDENYDIYVVELSSFQLESIINFKPNVGVILNLSSDHLDRHKTFDKYIEAKINITKNQSEKDYLVLNADCENTNKSRVYTKAKKMYISLNRKVNGAYKYNDCIYFDDDKIIDVKDIPIPGEHNIQNILAAVTVCKIIGINNEVISEQIKNFKAVKHRLELIGEYDGIKFFNDSKATNPDAAIKAIKAMDTSTILIAGGYDKKADYNEWLNIAKEKIKTLVLIGETADDIFMVAKSVGINDIVKCDSFYEAVNTCINKAEIGDNVLLSPGCASWGMFENYEHRGNEFIKLVENYYGKN